MKDLYVNIPIEAILTITKSILLKSSDTQIKQQIITLMKLILSRKYFTFQNNIYQPENGFTNLKYSSRNIFTIPGGHTYKTTSWHKKHNIYTVYVDNILNIYDTKWTNPDLTNTYINQVHTNLKLNLTHKSNGSFLDLLIIRKPSNLKIDIFRKPATTETTINFLLNHLIEHKIAIYRHHNTKMHSLPLTQKRKQTEWTLIKLIAQNNNFPQNSNHKI
jgi:hypothetical protein